MLQNYRITFGHTYAVADQQRGIQVLQQLVVVLLAALYVIVLLLTCCT